MIATAYHEAGHTAASLLLGVDVKHVSIIPRLEHDGSCIAGFVSHFSRGARSRRQELCAWPEVSSSKRRRGIETNIKISFAGKLAEKRAIGKLAPSCSMSDDLIVAYQLFLLSKHLTDINRTFRLLRFQTEDLLEYGWTLIETIAARLVVSGYLTNLELKTIYSGHFRYSSSY